MVAWLEVLKFHHSFHIIRILLKEMLSLPILFMHSFIYIGMNSQIPILLKGLKFVISVWISRYSMFD